MHIVDSLIRDHGPHSLPPNLETFRWPTNEASSNPKGLLFGRGECWGFAGPTPVPAIRSRGLWARAGTQQLGLSLTEAGATLSTEPDMCFASKPPVVHAFRIKADKQRRASNRIDAHSDSRLFADLIVMFFSLVSRRYVSKVVLIVPQYTIFGNFPWVGVPPG
jgi:hypothetical protein